MNPPCALLAMLAFLLLPCTRGKDRFHHHIHDHHHYHHFLDADEEDEREDQLNDVAFCNSYTLAGSVNDFAYYLFYELTSDEGNIMFSPFSIYVNLGMMLHGSRGRTARQLKQVLGLWHETTSEVVTDFKDILSRMALYHYLPMSNGIFLRSGLTADINYVNDIWYKYWYGSVNYMDFKDEVATQITVNSWTSVVTGLGISKFFDKAVDPKTQMLLLSALYFRGYWNTAFPESDTKLDDFHLSNGTVVKLNMMNLKYQSFRYFEDEETNYQFIELPYQLKYLSMFVALPKNATEWPSLQMTSDLFCRVNTSMELTSIELLSIPKFKLQYKTPLRNHLMDMGIWDLFDNDADLTGIRKHDDIFVNEFNHTAVIEIIETGYPALPVTGEHAQDHVQFVANHPFFFYVVDNYNGLIVLYARITDLDKILE